MSLHLEKKEMEIDYKKLAQSNKVLLRWKNKLLDNINTNNKKFFYDTYGIRRNSNIIKIAMMFKKYHKECCNLLGPNFSKDKSKMFYAEKVEDQLISQYIPAIILEMKKANIKDNETEEIYSGLLIHLRSSVWMYTRSNIKFCTFAINGIRSSVKFARAQIYKKSKAKGFMKTFLFEDMPSSCETESAKDFICVDNNSIEHGHVDSIDFINSICKEAKLTTLQKDAIFDFIKNGNSLNYKQAFFVAKRVLKKYIQKNTETITHISEIKFAAKE